MTQTENDIIQRQDCEVEEGDPLRTMLSKNLWT